MSQVISENSFETQLKTFLKLFNSYKQDYFSKKRKEYKKFNVALDFWQDLEGFMEGGKKLRGFLVYLGYLAAGGREIRKILPVCLAYETVHSFLLMHDDFIDRSDLRRGKPAIHNIYSKKHGEHFGESMAIIWGDVAAFEAVSLVNSAGFEANLQCSAQKFFAETIIETGFGEALDVLGAFENPKEDDIRNINLLKTAKYSVVGPLTLGAILAGAKKTQIDSIEKFGLMVGEAFQLRDDLLGVFGDEKKVGKSILSDMQEGKNTLLIYKTRQMTRREDQKVINRLWGKENASASDLYEIRKIMADSGALGWCEQEQKRLVEAASIHLNGITRYNDIRGIFRQLAEFVIRREN